MQSNTFRSRVENRFRGSNAGRRDPREKEKREKSLTRESIKGANKTHYQYMLSIWC